MTTAEKIGMVLRWCWTAVLIYMVYTETGPWTAVFCGLMALALEVQVVINRAAAKLSNALADLAVTLSQLMGRK